jgi:hypothetical protein
VSINLDTTTAVILPSLHLPMDRIVFTGLALVLPLLGAPLSGQVVLIEMEVVESPALDGRVVPGIGTYERLRGTFSGEVDPDHPLNREIVDLGLAPRNDRGRVEYRTTVEIYRPTDPARWNGAIHHTVPNRGGSVAPDPALLERGFAFVQVGWQGDIRVGGTNIVAALPVARMPDGSPVVGPALEEIIFNDADPVSTFDLTYPAVTTDPAATRLTVRRNRASPAAEPSDLSWRFLTDRRVEVTRPAGFDGGAIYEFVYQARDPWVMGVGFAAVRDAISFLRYSTTDERGTANPLRALPRAAASIGISQSGRFLRDFLYLGFNEDLAGRIVFDGMHPDIAGSRKTFTNYRFAQPGRWQKQHEDHLYPGDQFPFTYTTLTDPLTGLTDGLLVRCARSATCPRIVHTDGEAEIWQARSSLVVTDPAGRHLDLPGDVRVYLIAGTQHGGGPGVHTREPTAGICENLGNPMALSQIRRALMVALWEWVTDDREPPPSRFPTVAGGGLVPVDRLEFPKIPGVNYTGSVNPIRVLDHRSIPPVPGPAYPVLVGRVDGDGNMTDGIHHPNLAVPIGTYTGWNMRREGFGSGGQCAGTGSYIPFARTRAERLAAGDPRLSLEERYASPAAYVEAVAAAADRLVAERFLLPDDAAAITELARRAAPVVPER